MRSPAMRSALTQGTPNPTSRASQAAATSMPSRACVDRTGEIVGRAAPRQLMPAAISRPAMKSTYGLRPSIRSPSHRSFGFSVAHKSTTLIDVRLYQSSH